MFVALHSKDLFANLFITSTLLFIIFMSKRKHRTSYPIKSSKSLNGRPVTTHRSPGDGEASVKKTNGDTGTGGSIRRIIR